MQHTKGVLLWVGRSLCGWQSVLGSGAGGRLWGAWEGWTGSEVGAVLLALLALESARRHLKLQIRPCEGASPKPIGHGCDRLAIIRL
jgi:hypothetical protein